MFRVKETNSECSNPNHREIFCHSTIRRFIAIYFQHLFYAASLADRHGEVAMKESRSSLLITACQT